jgi:hypothetical protein
VRHRGDPLLGTAAGDLQRRLGCRGFDLLRDRAARIEARFKYRLDPGSIYPGGRCQRRLLRSLSGGHSSQMSNFREVWFSARWIVFVVGLVFAAVLTRFFAMGTISLQ